MTDLSDIEERFSVKFHQDLIDYFNSYWVLELIGFCGDHNVSLCSVVPSAETEEFELRLTDYYETNGVLDYIPIGFDATTYKLIFGED